MVEDRLEPEQMLPPVLVTPATSPHDWRFVDVSTREPMLDVVRCVMTVSARDWPMVELVRQRLDGEGRVVLERDDAGVLGPASYSEVRRAVFADSYRVGSVPVGALDDRERRAIRAISAATWTATRRTIATPLEDGA